MRSHTLPLPQAGCVFCWWQAAGWPVWRREGDHRVSPAMRLCRDHQSREKMHENQAQFAGYSPGCGCAKAVTRSLGEKHSSVSAERKWRLDRRVTGVQAGRNASGSQTAPSDQCLRPCVQQRLGKISVLNASATAAVNPKQRRLPLQGTKRRRHFSPT